MYCQRFLKLARAKTPKKTRIGGDANESRLWTPTPAGRKGKQNNELAENIHLWLLFGKKNETKALNVFFNIQAFLFY